MINRQYLPIADMIPREWGVICIDVWHEDGAMDENYRRALSRLNRMPIRKIINASTSRILTYQDKSVWNTLMTYLWAGEGESIPQGHRNDILLGIIRDAGDREISKILNDELFDLTTICVHDLSSFREHCRLFCPDIHHWIVLGHAWQLCTHNSGMGFRTLNSAPEHNIYIFPEWSVWHLDGSPVSDEDIENDYLEWSPTRSNGYIMNPSTMLCPI